VSQRCLFAIELPCNRVDARGHSMNASYIRRTIVSGCVLCAICYLWWSVVHDRRLGADVSPDGKLRADYSYQVRDVIGLIEPGANPLLHLTITDLQTGKVISRQDYLGDVSTLNEARERFAPQMPWDPREQTR
jgi:hypothetical protein